MMKRPSGIADHVRPAWPIAWIAACVSAEFGQAEPPGAVDLAGEIELARLIDLSAQRLNLKIDYDAASVKGTITLRLGEPLSDGELWVLTNQSLAARGLATVHLPGASDRALSVVKSGDASAYADIEAAESGAEGPAGFVSVVARLRHQPAKPIVEALKPILSKPGGSATDLGSGGLLLLSDFRTRVDEALTLIELLDVAGQQPVVERVAAQHVSASQIAALAGAATTVRDALMPAAATGKIIASAEGDALVLVCLPSELPYWRDLIQRLDQREAVTTQAYAPRHFGVAEVGRLIEQALKGSGSSTRGSTDRWRLVTDELTGTLIITAAPSEHARIAELMARLDAMPAASRRPVKVFAIRNRSVSEIVDVLAKLQDAGALEGTEVEASAPSVQPGGEARSVERVPGLAAATGGSGIARATSELSTPPPKEAGPIASETQTDSRRDAALRPSAAKARNGAPRALTMTADEGTNTLIAVGEPRLLGQLDDLIRRLDVRQPQVMIEVMVVNLSEADTLDLGVELKKIEVSGDTIITLSSLFGLGTPASGIPLVIPGGRGFSGVVLNPGDFSVVLRALQTINRGRTLTLPKVLVNNNQQATLDSVLQQPFISTNASDTVATTSFGGTDNAGTVITIKPQIAEGDHLILEYTVTLSSFVGEAADPTVPPPKQSNNLSSVVTIPDGYTVVVGGLEISSDADAVSQVPLLSDVPLVGEAFRNRSKSMSKSRFYVFIRSEVLRHERLEDLKYLSDQALTRAGTKELGGWPQVEPRIIR
jgi:type II secretory pathway component GspD/PulD (secretin)